MTVSLTGSKAGMFDGKISELFVSFINALFIIIIIITGHVNIVFMTEHLRIIVNLTLVGVVAEEAGHVLVTGGVRGGVTRGEGF